MSRGNCWLGGVTLQSNTAREDRIGELGGGLAYDPARAVQDKLDGTEIRQAEVDSHLDEARRNQSRRNDCNAEPG